MNTEEQQSLEAIRFKITHSQTDFNRQEILHLAVVYAYISRYAGKERVLKTDCQGCLLTAMNIVSNYINSYEQIDKPIENLPSFEMVGDAEIIGVSFTDKPIKGMEWLSFNSDKPNTESTLKELRKKYPNIKSNSRRKFLEKLNELKNK